MNYELFIAKNILFKKGKKEKSNTKPIIRIAIAGVSLSMAVMLISVAIVTGFQKEIRNKVIGFGSHIQIRNFSDNLSYENNPINRNQPFLGNIKQTQGVRHLQVFATKAGIIKTEDNIEGVVLKGIGADFDWQFFKSKITEGSVFSFIKDEKSNDLLVSKYIAKRLKLKINDPVYMYFVQDPPRIRKFNVRGIYETGLEELDKVYVIGDIRHIQKLNDWKENEVGGFEILINDFNQIDEIGKKVYSKVGYNFNTQTVKEVYPQIFDWLKLQDINVIIIITLMVLVAAINMISALLIIILERTNMIGILKALGARNVSIRKVFLYTASYLTFIGIFLGNLFGLGLCLIQQKFSFLKLPQESYYVSFVPVNIEPLYILVLNAGTLVICFLMLILPSYLITRISPLKAIRFN